MTGTLRCISNVSGRPCFWLTAVLFFGVGLQSSWAQSVPQKPLEWHVLLIIKAKGDIHMEGLPDVKYQLTKLNIAAVTKAFQEYTTDWVRILSNGRLTWKADVVISDIPLRRITRIPAGSMVGPECVQEDLEKHAPPGKYDGVFIYWKDMDDKTNASLAGGYGWSLSSATGHNGYGYSCINCALARDLGRDSEWTEIFLHEWLHHLEAFYFAKGIRIPSGGLHGGANYEGLKGPKAWYRAFINGEIPEKDGGRCGLGEMAWRWGTMRDEVNLHLPSYVTPERRRANLLTNASFEDGANDWSYRSASENKNGFTINEVQTKSGKKSARLQSEKMDDAVLWQKVRVNPKTRYLLTGWVKTEQVHLQNKEQVAGAFQSGAFLAVSGVKRDASKVKVGTQDWTYVSHVFITGDATEVEIGPRLGNGVSPALGSAWFDDLVLLDIALPAPISRSAVEK